eukprot:1194715-Prorocentrum_minimum.AAC.5
MSCYVCPSCGHEEAIFGHGGAKREAEELGVELLGQVWLLYQPKSSVISSQLMLSSPPAIDTATTPT